ncbi:two-component system sensor histidine kinase NtrB [Desulfobulbus alkaliphilus]|uniref:two-component system sensor histidine kinase NtrB n=1 Tax=Desulfobulbus alkaliphilus TaxID=869814 RepID=UPI0019624037|nr:ATP-binding protein [Desulfobulbus alkaliphilus]MBM9536382.1 PAS domain-containing protein [Desulfobulbus alkaliphilus]
MFRLLTKALIPAADREQETRRHLFWWLLIRVCLFTLLISISSFFHEKGHPVILPPLAVTLFFLCILYGYSIAAALLLQRGKGGPVRRFAIIQLLSDTVFVALLVYATGCSQSIFTTVFILPVIAGGLILSRMGGLIPAAAATLLYGAVLTGELLGWIPEYFHAGPYQPPQTYLTGTNLFAVYGIIFFLAALLSEQLARRLRFTEEKLTKTSLEYDRLSLLYKQIFDDISTGIITTDHGNVITSCNHAAERITGYPRGKILGQPFNRCFPGILLHDRQGRSVCDFEKSDGMKIRIGYSFSFLNMPVEQGPGEGLRMKWKVVTLQDISQIERMERQIREGEKMAAIGELSASIAHDFRNPLAAISGSAQILNLEAANIASLNPDTLRSLLGIILRESKRMAQTITDFLQFARPAPIQPEWFDMNRLLDDVLYHVRTQRNAPAPEKIVKEIDSRLHCWADRQQLHTVLTHLIENACFATAGTSEAIVISASEIHEDGMDGIRIEVRDQGPGIPDELGEKVFQPFFSSRTDGTGLGLAIARQIIDNHRGSIAINSSEPQGCIVRLYLPLPQTVTP